MRDADGVTARGNGVAEDRSRAEVPMTDPAQPWQRPSIYDVARRAGVSHMTVSRVLNEHPNIKESTRERVLQAIEEMHYTRSSIARALATRRAMRIGVIVDGPVEYGPSGTLRARERAARERGYATSAFSVVEGDAESVETRIRDLVAQGVDALCVIAPRSSSLDLLRRHALRIPTLAITARSEPGLLTAGVDQHAGASAAVRHLVALGHREILHIAGPLDWLDARARAEAWRAVLDEEGLTVREPLVGDWTSDFGYGVGLGAEAIDDVTAVFVSNDQMALGLIHGLAERGLRVPDDISVVGFDDVPDARHFLPPLTTVRQDFAALGTSIVEMLVERIVDGGAPRSLLREPELVLRSSTAAPSAQRFTRG